MRISMSHELYIFCIMFALGAAEGVLFDIFRVARRMFCKKTAAGAFSDLIFWVAAAVLFGYIVMKATYGEIRGYMLLAGAGGLLIYFLSLSRLIILLISRIIEFFLKIFQLIFKILLTPAAFLYKILLECFFRKVRFFLHTIKCKCKRVNLQKKRNKNVKEKRQK